MYSNKNIPAPFNQPQHTNCRKETPASQLPTPSPSKNNAERLGTKGFPDRIRRQNSFSPRRTVVHGEENATAVRRLAEGKCFDKVSRLSSRRNLSVFPAILLVKILILTKGEKKSPP